MWILVIIVLLTLQVFSASLVASLICWKRNSLTISNMDVVVFSVGVVSVDICLCILLISFFNFIQGW